jgi:threonine dehydratase
VLAYIIPYQEHGMIDKDYCQKAFQNIRKILAPTPLVFSDHYSKLLGKEIYFKLENKFYTGSFKERGALNFILNLNTSEKKRGVCAASAGNHALALSYHARKHKIRCAIVMPIHAPLVKVSACQENRAEVLSRGETFSEALSVAEELSKKEKLVLAPAFDHEDVIAGQASCAFEILKLNQDFDTIVVPVGGGGLISGIATVIKALKPKTHILGVQSEWASMAQKSKHTGSGGALRTISIADGIAIKKIGRLTGQIIAKKVDELTTVSEAEISESIVEFLQIEKMLIEGAAAAAIAGLRKAQLSKKQKKIIVVISGSNIDTTLLLRLIERDMAEHQRVFRLRLAIPDRPGSLNAMTQILAEKGVNILQVQHDRSFSKTPGNVEVTLLLEVRDSDHKFELLKTMNKFGIETITI